MSKKFREYKDFNLSKINKEILDSWGKEKTFDKCLESREGKKSFVFYEGPPSANGVPGIHHVMARTIKDIFCRYKTLDGYKVNRKAGWDTHGLPVELSVEKSLGISKEDIGTKISVAEYNETCRKEVMKFTAEWEELTKKMGYWVNMKDPYITFDNRYIESVWYLLKQFFDKGLLYKGYSIQPYSPAAGTGLSTHELNQPGCYRDVKDTTCIAQFKVVKNEKSAFLFENNDEKAYFLAWTTTPWTLPSNTALAVGKNIKYVKVKTFNPYSGEPVSLILAKDLVHQHFHPDNKNLLLAEYDPGDKKIPYEIKETYSGKDLELVDYEQLIEWVRPQKEAFKVLVGDFVSTEEGTGIVHIAPTFGADDYRVADYYDFPSILVKTNEGNFSPLIDKKGRFFRIEKMDREFSKKYVIKEKYAEFSGRYVKNEYDESLSEKDPTVDVDIAVMLKKENKAFKIEKHTHNYPHCWRTDKPVLYYPLDSWFIKTTVLKDKLIALNETINWKPDSTGTGRFGKWLENLVDWNLSRSRYWGTPLPVWSTESGSETTCIGSMTELKKAVDKSVKAGFMKNNPLEKFEEGNNSPENYTIFDLHRPFVDNIVLVSKKGEKMTREEDLIDVWFDSGAMPYAQVHYPFENKEMFEQFFPADFIAEGVDQTRGWFFTLHAIAVMLFDSVAYKNIVSNGLVLDKSGNKMSKRLGNAVDPFETIEKYGADPLRWYMITNAQPWDNLKFDVQGVDEIKRKFFGTLYNTYSFFALYANVDGFTFSEKQVAYENKPEIDRWIISVLHSLIKNVKAAYEDFEPTKAGRLIQDFVIENLSNWYVRLNRKRFWGGEKNEDKTAAYQTLYECLLTVAKLASPIAPFYTDMIYHDLNSITGKEQFSSVHLCDFPQSNDNLINTDLERKMDIAQKVSSMVLGLRRKVNIKVRQPLGKIMVPVLDEKFKTLFQGVEKLILTEVNVKEVDYLSDASGVLVKKIKPNFKRLGPKFGKMMKQISGAFATLDQESIAKIEKENEIELKIDNQIIKITLEDVEIVSEDIPGWLVANEGNLTVALDVTITGELKQEGIAREFINRIQNLRKDSGFDVTDKIDVRIQKNTAINGSVEKHRQYIGSQTLAENVELVDTIQPEEAKLIEFDENVKTYIKVNKL